MHDKHRERMRKRYLINGVDTFEDHEVIELALYYIISVKDTNVTAHELMNRFGSISAIFDAPINMLKEVNGIGDRAAIFIKIIADLARLYMDRRFSHKGKIMTFEECCDKIALQFIGRYEELVALMLFDAKGKMLYNGIVSKGTVNAVDLYARKMLNMITTYNAVSVLIAHNHPSGLAFPSNEDIEATAKLLLLLQSMRVRLKDHLIVADGDYLSLRSSDLRTIPGIRSDLTLDWNQTL